MGALKSDAGVQEAWNTYHVIGDALRGQAVLAADVRSAVASRLAEEPTVLAPRSRRSLLSPSRFALSMAASVCGIAVVGWLALYNNSVSEPQSTQIAAQSASPAASAMPVQVAAVPANSSMNDYLMAHQEFSPSTAMQGMVPYVRTVSVRDAAR